MEVFFPTLLLYSVVAHTIWNRMRAEYKARGPGRNLRAADRAEKYGPRITLSGTTLRVFADDVLVYGCDGVFHLNQRTCSYVLVDSCR